MNLRFLIALVFLGTATAAPAAAQPATPTSGRAEASDRAEPSRDAPADAEPAARWNRLAISLTFGIGSIALGGYEDLVTDIRGFAARQGVSFDEEPASHLQINAALSARYYFPYYVMFGFGYGALYNKSSSTASAGAIGGTVSTHNVVMEVPLLIGGYYPAADWLFVHAAVGPAFFFFSRSYWDIQPGSASDFEADGGVGAHFVVGADLFANDNLAFGFELRYRLMESGELRDQDSGVTVTSGPIRGDGSSDRYTIDYSGISAALSFRLFVL